MDGIINMSIPVISIAPLLWHNQCQRVLDTTITHGKGRRGVIIRSRSRSRSRSRLSCIKNAFLWGSK